MDAIVVEFVTLALVVVGVVGAAPGQLLRLS
jgi:hypothetical protein